MKKRRLPSFFYHLKFQILAPLVVLFFVVASSSLVIIINLQERLEQIEQQSLINSKINKAIFTFDRIRSSVKTDMLAYLLTSNKSLKESIERLELIRKREEPNLFEALKVRPDFEDDFKKLEKTYQKTTELRRRVLLAVEARNMKKALRFFNSYSSIYEINSARLIDLRNRLETESSINRRETSEFYTWLLLFMIFIVVFGSAVILYSFKYYRENLWSPIKDLKLGLNEIQAGHFPTIEGHGSSSVEIQEIIQDFNDTVINLQSIKGELLTANENALNLARIKSDFLSNMSHEIRTPLNSIIGMGQLLQDYKHQKEVTEYISTIVNSGNLLLNIVNDILDLSKLETGKIELDLLPCNLKDLVGRINSSFVHLFKEKSLFFKIEIDPTTPKNFLADCNRLEQIILNLLSNAFKFTPSGGVELFISPKISSSGSKMLEFKVRDTGIGIESDTQELLFSRFTQADSSITKQYGGTGLGLSIVKELVELMQGRIEVVSKLGEGSTFSVIVPLVEVASENFKQASSQESSKNETLKSFDYEPRILLVDDSIENRKIVKLFLSNLPVAIDEAENGIEAIAAFERSQYNLILMDMQMPILDGHSATRKIREKENLSEGSRLPIIALTAYVMEEEVEKSKAAGCDAHLPKPINRDLLINTVIQYLNQ